MISAGGTGGHVYPALTLAKALQQAGREIYWLGTDKGIETRLVPEAGIFLFSLKMRGLRNKGLRSLAIPFLLFFAVLQAIKILKQTRCILFVGFGGYASAPGALAARLLGIPVILHEQNAAMGLTNRTIARWARAVLLGFPIAHLPASVQKKSHVVGNPVRQDIATISISHLRQQAPFRLLVIGGSLGAKALNELIPTALLPLIQTGLISLMHQTGPAHYAMTKAVYESLGIAVYGDEIPKNPQQKYVQVFAYIDDMKTAYEQADILIARAGALTVSEVASAGIPAIFVPLPHAVDNHQYLNAKFLADAGGAVIIEQKDLTDERLQQTLMQLLNWATLSQMAQLLKDNSHQYALNDILTLLTEVANEPTNHE